MYKNLKAIYSKTRLDMFSMAVAHLLDIGFRSAEKITDNEIAQMEGNGLMTQGFVQDLVRLSREIARACDGNPVELIQFCMAEEVFEIKWYANKPTYSDLVSYILNAMDMLEHGGYAHQDMFENWFGIEDEDDREYFLKGE